MSGSCASRGAACCAPTLAGLLPVNRPAFFTPRFSGEGPSRGFSGAQRGRGGPSSLSLGARCNPPCPLPAGARVRDFVSGVLKTPEDSRRELIGRPERTTPSAPCCTEQA